jgi:hypothetical protein
MKVLAFILLLVILIYILISRKKKPQTIRYTFPKPSVVHQTVEHSSFFQRLSKDDLSARNVSSIELYLQRYKKSISPLSSIEKKTIEEMLYQIEKRLKDQQEVKIAQALLNSEWSIAKHNDPMVEGGYPHTLGRIVFLPASFFESVNTNLEARRQTLLHEQIHVLQRQNPEVATDFVNTYFSAPRKHRSEFEKKVSLRLNPDLDDYIYGFPSQGKIHYLAQIYITTNPKSLSQSKPVLLIEPSSSQVLSQKTEALLSSVEQIEHPYEVMACHYSEKLLSSEIKSKI